MTTESLYIESYTEVVREWTEVNNIPWLDNDLTNYIYTNGDGNVHSEFNFADHAGSESITTTNLYLEIQGNSGRNDKIIIEVWDGTGWIEVVTLDPDNNAYQWYNWDIASVLDTWTKINGAKLRVAYDRSGSPATQNIYVRRAYLQVEFTTAGWFKLQYTTEPPSTGWNRLKYVSEPPVPSAWNKLAYEGE